MHETGRLIEGWKQFAEEQGASAEVDAVGVAPRQLEEASIQPDLEPEPTEDKAMPSDRPVALLHD
jgi:hypothetical protein